MKLCFTVIAFFFVAVCAGGLNLKASDGDNVTIPFRNAGLERADQVMITFTRENQKTMIARYCRCAHCWDCNVVETPRVLLRVKEGNLILLRVNSNNSGLYEAKIITDNNVFETSATLDVNKPAFTPSTALPHPSPPNPPDSSEHQRLYALLILPAILILGMLVFFCRRTQHLDCAAVSFKACTEDTDDQLVDT